MIFIGDLAWQVRKWSKRCTTKDQVEWQCTKYSDKTLDKNVFSSTKIGTIHVWSSPRDHTRLFNEKVELRIQFIKFRINRSPYTSVKIICARCTFQTLHKTFNTSYDKEPSHLEDKPPRDEFVMALFRDSPPTQKKTIN